MSSDFGQNPSVHNAKQQLFASLSNRADISFSRDQSFDNCNSTMDTISHSVKDESQPSSPLSVNSNGRQFEGHTSTSAALDDDNVQGYKDYSRVTLDDLRDPSAFIYAAASAKEPPFPVKLHRILCNPDFSDIISWLPHGRSWRVLKPKAFEERVIPLHFRHCRYSSFMRQVNGWGFMRVHQGPDLNSYYHELFLRGLPHLCLKMRRPTGKQNYQIHYEASKGATPDFYSISKKHPLPDYKKTLDFQSSLDSCSSHDESAKEWVNGPEKQITSLAAARQNLMNFEGLIQNHSFQNSLGNVGNLGQKGLGHDFGISLNNPLTVSALAALVESTRPLDFSSSLDNLRLLSSITSPQQQLYNQQFLGLTNPNLFSDALPVIQLLQQQNMAPHIPPALPHTLSATSLSLRGNIELEQLKQALLQSQIQNQILAATFGSIVKPGNQL